MTLASVIQNVVSGVFDSLTGITSTVVYHSSGTSTYNPSTGQITKPDETQEVKLIQDEKSQARYMKFSLQPGDQVGLVPTKDFVGTPDIDDWIVIEGREWFVVDWSVDPAKALYQLHMRTQ